MSVQNIFLLAKETAEKQVQNQERIEKVLSKTNTEIDLLKSLVITDRSETDNPAPQTHLAASDVVVLASTNPSFDQTGNIDHVKAFHHNGSVLFESAQMTAVAAVGIRAVQFPRTACTSWCSCVCHRETKLQTPRILEKFIGSLFVGYSGLPILRAPCNERNSCRLQAQPLAHVTYFFPQWFLSRMVTFMMTVTPLAGPVASLKVQRVVSGNADVFNFARVGDVAGMKSLFERGLASPHDVQHGSGVTPLHVSTDIYLRVNI